MPSDGAIPARAPDLTLAIDGEKTDSPDTLVGSRGGRSQKLFISNQGEPSAERDTFVRARRRASVAPRLLHMPSEGTSLTLDPVSSHGSVHDQMSRIIFNTTREPSRSNLTGNSFKVLRL